MAFCFRYNLVAYQFHLSTYCDKLVLPYLLKICSFVLHPLLLAFLLGSCTHISKQVNSRGQGRERSL